MPPLHHTAERSPAHTAAAALWSLVVAGGIHVSIRQARVTSNLSLHSPEAAGHSRHDVPFRAQRPWEPGGRGVHPGKRRRTED